MNGAQLLSSSENRVLVYPPTLRKPRVSVPTNAERLSFFNFNFDFKDSWFMLLVRAWL
jgi:hypothetical protein